LIYRQMRRDSPGAHDDATFNAGGGVSNSMSIAQLASWCDERFGRHAPDVDMRSRPFDIPWMVLDSSRAAAEFGWVPRQSLESILDEIAAHAGEHPEWRALCGAT
jgi:CDP-paratose 2-epimerase